MEGEGIGLGLHSVIKVSELTQYMICPRQVYFSAKGHEMKREEKSTVESYILKEIAFNLSKIKEEEDEEIDVRSMVEEIANEIEWVYKDELKRIENKNFEDVKNGIIQSLEDKNWLKKVKSETLFFELETREYEREHTLFSQKLNMHGSVDKLLRIDSEIVPCLVKTGRCPDYDIWKRDKVQLAAYAMLIEEEFETTVRRGFVEYIKEGEFRETLIKRRDRAMALQVLRKVKKIKRGVGTFPEKGRNIDCHNCSFIEMCEPLALSEASETKKTLLSKLLGWK